MILASRYKYAYHRIYQQEKCVEFMLAERIAARSERSQHITTSADEVVPCIASIRGTENVETRRKG